MSRLLHKCLHAFLHPTESNFGQMVKFGIAGGVATIADCSVLWFLLAIFGAKRISFWGLNTESYLIYNTISYTVGATVSYVLSV